jgi:hypothetical protein
MSLKTGQFITVNGKWGNDLVEADSIGMMVLSMKVIGEIIWPTVKVDLSTVTAMFTLANGKMIKHMVMVLTSIWTEHAMKETGSKTNNMDSGSNLGPMELNMKEIIIWAKKMDKVNFSGLIILRMKEISAIIVFMVKVYMSGLTVESTRGNGKIIKWTVLVSGEGEFTW